MAIKKEGDNIISFEEYKENPIKAIENAPTFVEDGTMKSFRIPTKDVEAHLKSIIRSRELWNDAYHRERRDRLEQIKHLEKTILKYKKQIKTLRKKTK